MTWQDMRSGWIFEYEPGALHVDVLTDDGQRRVDTIKISPQNDEEWIRQELARAIDEYVYERFGE